MENQPTPDALLKTHTAAIVAAFIGRNQTPMAELPNVIVTVHGALAGLGQHPEQVPVETVKPAVPIRKSVTPDYLVCLDCGKQSKMLKRHIMTAHSLSPDEYRKKWGLSSEYPLVAPNYANERSALAKQIGLGRGSGRALAAPESAPAVSRKATAKVPDKVADKPARGRRAAAENEAPANA